MIGDFFGGSFAVGDKGRFCNFDNIHLKSDNISDFLEWLKTKNSLEALYFQSNSIDDEAAVVLASFLENAENFKKFGFYSNIVSPKGMDALLGMLKRNKYIFAFDFISNMRNQYSKAFDDVILHNKNILHSILDYAMSSNSTNELEKRQNAIKAIAYKWDARKDHNGFITQEIGAQEIGEVYNNRASLKYLSQYTAWTKIDDIIEFEREICCMVYARWGIVVGRLLKQHLPIELVKYTMCFWMQLPFDIKATVSNTPELPKMQEENQLITR